MSSLTGQQINQTYQGLLKLENSTTGITQNFQNVQDGLGNNTGVRFATNIFQAPNLLSMVPLKAQYYGNGYQTTAGSQFNSAFQGVIAANMFYDNSQFSYSAISFNVITATTSSDTFEFAIYTSQLINPNGLYPYQPIVSGLTVNVASTGIKTVTFPSNISMSGYGAGIYFLVFKISNAGVQPTVRFGATNMSPVFQQFNSMIYGQTAVLGGGYSPIGIRNNGAGSGLVFSGLTTFDNPYAGNIDTLQSTTTTITGHQPGFILHTV